MSFIEKLKSFFCDKPAPSQDGESKKNQPEEVVGPAPIVTVEYQDQVLAPQKTRHELLIEKARSFLGVREQGGNNRGSVIETFQQSIGPYAKFQPWCASFVWHCLRLVEKESGGVSCPLKLTAHVMTIWNTAPAGSKKKYGAPGYLMVWRKFDAQGRALSDGHIGIVEERLNSTVYVCIEGNTSPEVNVNRDGDGVYRRQRNSGAVGSMRCIGFLDPWAI